MKMQVTYFFRKPQPQYHSIERVFNLIIENLPDSVDSKIYKLKSGEKGIVSRLKALVETNKNKGAINHITGDISYVALALPRKGLVLTFHDLESLLRDDGLKSKFLKWIWVKLPAQRATAVTVISEHTKKQVMEWSGINENKIHVITNPLPKGFLYTPKSGMPDVPLFLVIGTKHNKNLEGIIDAVVGLKCKLLIAGRLSESQRDLLGRKGIDFENLVGATDEQIIDAYKRSDLLCFPSFFEGFGMPIIEAQAIGRPVITSCFGAMMEVAGEGAFLIDPYNPQDIRRGILKVLEDGDLRTLLVKKGLENASRFDAESLTAKYVEVYENSLAK